MANTMKRLLPKILLIILLPALFTFGLSKYIPVPVFEIQKANAAFSSFRMMMGAAGTGITATIPHTKAVDFDGSTEYMESSSTTFGFGDVWTMAIWFEVDDIISTDSIFGFKTPGNDNNKINIECTTGGAPDGSLRVLIWDSSGNEIKHFLDTTNFAINTKYSVIVTFDGSAGGDPALAYVDNSLIIFNTINTDTTGTMTDAARVASAGREALTAGKYFDGTIPKVSMWNIILSTNQRTAYYDAGTGYQNDDRIVNGNYDSTAVAALQHQWLPGNNIDPDIGHDYSDNSVDLNSDTGGNITDADIVTY